ncbi:hypothetical protein OA84_03405 [Kaistella solincola]|uniref:Uncharacterized protein n=1 Tax=Kaistella solincola TaxID=510955 RepID=A0ABR4ZV58_9FLAO|nr:hypothetical protein OA84_03405 [Kaistella solincola]
MKHTSAYFKTEKFGVLTANFLSFAKRLNQFGFHLIIKKSVILAANFFDLEKHLQQLRLKFKIKNSCF